MSNLTLILLETKVIILYHQSAHSCSLIRLYTVGWPTSHLDIPKMIMDSSEPGMCIIPFKKFSRLRVKHITSITVQKVSNIITLFGHTCTNVRVINFQVMLWQCLLLPMMPLQSYHILSSVNLPTIRTFWQVWDFIIKLFYTYFK